MEEREKDKMARNPIEPKKVFELTVISFIIIEALSFLASQLGLMDFVKGGWIIFLFLLVIVLTMLFNLGINITQVKMKEIILGLIVLVIVVLLYLFLPSILPQVFSIIPGNEINYQVRDFIAKTIGSVAGLGGTGVV